MEFYERLGVEKTASAEEIRKAYKRLAMKHHPDRGGDSETLSKINEAYTVLKDPEKRRAYDNPNPFNSGSGPRGYHNVNMNDIFDDAFSDFFRSAGRGFGHKNQDLQMQTLLTLRDCFSGKEFNAQYQLRTGEHKHINIHIPPGLRQGDTLRIPGAGDNSITNLPPGDVLLRVNIKTPHNWDLHDYDLITSVNVNVFDLMKGTHVVIENPINKKLKLKVPAGTNPGTVLTLKGEGIPKQKTKLFGNMHVRIDTNIPKIESEELLKQLDSFKNELDQIP